ncbi:hypothetical protein RHMOL_Rhmol04G0107800 [Rhododendron molle]|uniref:Uncharacterized protein n=1 Tax=Rhododendron molle TaxID=49168 RepID=A0ACC0NZ92_RHOML|nr:hypothetical protein RHMOL_Rhmol04G0107800 [Rhododendron molle]
MFWAVREGLVRFFFSLIVICWINLSGLFGWQRRSRICEAAEFVVLIPLKSDVWLSFEGARDKHCSGFISTRWICEALVRPRHWQIRGSSDGFTPPNSPLNQKRNKKNFKNSVTERERNEDRKGYCSSPELLSLLPPSLFLCSFTRALSYR